MASIPTVRVKGGKGEPSVIIINAEDFDEKIHTLAPAEPAKAAGDDESAETVDPMKLSKEALIQLAADKGIELVPDEVTKKQIVERIEAASGE